MKTLCSFLVAMVLLAMAILCDAGAQIRRNAHTSQDQSILQLNTAATDEGGAFKGRLRSTPSQDSQKRIVRTPKHTGALPLGNRLLVPQQYPTIQAAINAATDGDTVLVSQGTYFENIRFRGKAIIVASTYLTTGDTARIQQTIVDGSNPSHPDSGSVVYFIDGEDTTSVLCGFTIRGGTGTLYYYYSGIWCRVGGGVFCELAGARIVRNVITRNRVIAATVEGGGVCVMGTASFHPYVILEANRVTDNYVRGDSSATWAWSGGADLCNASARVIGNVFERDTVVGAYSATAGGIGILTDPPVQLVEGHFQGNIFRSNVVSATLSGAVGAGMIVGRTGGVTISENLFENNIGTSVSGWAQGGGLCVDDQTISGYGRKMIVKNRFIGNRLTRGGGSNGCGGGLILFRTLATLNANEIASNSANGYGGGVYVNMSAFRIENNIIRRNSTTIHGGGLHIEYAPQVGTEQVLVNNTIVANRADSYAGGLLIGGMANIVSLNNIFWADTAQYGHPEIYVSSGTVNVHYCDIQSGWLSGAGNINADPLFVMGRLDSLQANSPCRDAGRDTLTSCCTSDYHRHIRPWPVGGRPDIGVEEYGSTIIIGVKNPPELPQGFVLSQNYPNPFNPSSTIRYALPHTSFVTLTVCNTLGQQVAQLVNEQQQAGYHDVVFRGDGLASGVYFYRLDAGSFTSVKKLLLLK